LPVPPPPLPFFVYGTLRPGQANHRRYLAGRGCAVEPAALPGAALHHGPGFPYAVEDAAGTVQGELVSVPAAEYAQVLAALDRLEGHRGDGTGEYVRLRRSVLLPDGTQRDAWVYLAGPPVAARLLRAPAPIGSGDWNARD
jgi:gamma-glutamylcyclotransferase (GGCT)/AIG2-like uncharacterized protein YtfP